MCQPMTILAEVDLGLVTNSPLLLENFDAMLENAIAPLVIRNTFPLPHFSLAELP